MKVLFFTTNLLSFEKIYLHLQSSNMELHLTFKVNNNIFLRDPESSELGHLIVKHGIDLIYELGFEQFTFKKLAAEVHTTEASIYRYFENKHRLLLYILNWYWSYMEFLLMFKIQNMQDPGKKLKAVVRLFTTEISDPAGQNDYNKKYLNQIVIAESAKVYLTKEVKEINKHEVFKPYKDLCATISDLIREYNPKYKYARSLSSTLIEAAHQQQYFCDHLPRLTDCGNKPKAGYVNQFLENLVFSTLG